MGRPPVYRPSPPGAADPDNPERISGRFDEAASIVETAEEESEQALREAKAAMAREKAAARNLWLEENDYWHAGIPHGNTPLPEIYDEFIRQAIADFPHLKDTLVVAGLTSDSVHTGSRRLTTESMYLESTPEADYLARMMETADQREVTNPLGLSMYANTHDSLIVVQKEKRDIRVISTSADPYETEIRNILEHELGHIVAPGGISHSRTVDGENVADTFAFTRQLGRGEDITRPLEGAIWSRTYTFLTTNESDHLSTFSLMGLRDIAARHDLSGLSPAEAANTAFRLALQNVPDRNKMQELADIFKPVTEAWKTAGRDEGFRACAEIMLQDHGELSETVFRLGKAFLDPALNNRLDILTIRLDLDTLLENPLKFEGEVWDDLLPKLKEREAALARQVGAIDPAQAENLDGYRRAIQQEVGDLKALGQFDSQRSTIIPSEQYKHYSRFMDAGGEVYTRLRFAQDKGYLPSLDQTGYEEIAKYFEKESFGEIRPLMAKMIVAGHLDALGKQIDLSGLNTDQALALAQKVSDPLRVPDDGFGGVFGVLFIGPDEPNPIDKYEILEDVMKNPSEENLGKLADSLIPAKISAELTIEQESFFRAGRLVIEHHLSRQNADGSPVLAGEKWDTVRKNLDAANTAIDEAFLASAAAVEMMQSVESAEHSLVAADHKPPSKEKITDKFDEVADLSRKAGEVADVMKAARGAKLSKLGIVTGVAVTGAVSAAISHAHHTQRELAEDLNKSHPELLSDEALEEYLALNKNIEATMQAENVGAQGWLFLLSTPAVESQASVRFDAFSNKYGLRPDIHDMLNMSMFEGTSFRREFSENVRDIVNEESDGLSPGFAQLIEAEKALVAAEVRHKNAHTTTPGAQRREQRMGAEERAERQQAREERREAATENLNEARAAYYAELGNALANAETRQALFERMPRETLVHMAAITSRYNASGQDPLIQRIADVQERLNQLRGGQSGVQAERFELRREFSQLRYELGQNPKILHEYIASVFGPRENAPDPEAQLATKPAAETDGKPVMEDGEIKVSGLEIPQYFANLTQGEQPADTVPESPAATQTPKLPTPNA